MSVIWVEVVSHLLENRCEGFRVQSHLLHDCLLQPYSLVFRGRPKGGS